MNHSVWLPLPPTVNHAYANVPGRGRVSTKAKKDWQKRAYALLPPTPIQKQPVGYGVVVSIVVGLSAWRSDIDNYTKLTLDTVLPTLGLDDRYITHLVVQRRTVPRGEEGVAVDVNTYVRE